MQTSQCGGGVSAGSAAGFAPHQIAATENPIMVRVDYAVGRDGSHGFYVGIGQAF